MSAVRHLRKTGMPRRLAGAALSLLLPLLAACGEGALGPGGRDASIAAGLWWLMLWLAVVVFALVMTALAVALVRGGRRRTAEPGGSLDRWLVIGGGIVLPSMVFVVLMFLSVRSGRDISEAEERVEFDIEIVGHQWWWEVRYPDEGIVTANEVHLPVDRAVRLRLTSHDVIHSFWVPGLAGKRDLVPGRENTLTLEPEQVGEFRGWCAEFCGMQHTNMRLLVVVQEAEDFTEWVTLQQQDAPSPETGPVRDGQQVFLGSSCVYCHTVRGTSASGDIGPDLTHVAGRKTLAAGAIPNTRGNLAGWVLDPHTVKPGTQMPASLFTSEELQVLLDYLQSLE